MLQPGKFLFHAVLFCAFLMSSCALTPQTEHTTVELIVQVQSSPIAGSPVGNVGVEFCYPVSHRSYGGVTGDDGSVSIIVDTSDPNDRALVSLRENGEINGDIEVRFPEGNARLVVVGFLGYDAVYNKDGDLLELRRRLDDDLL